MADRYWVGGTGTWDNNALLKWSLTSGGVGGEAVPTAADDVYFDLASGAVTITLSGARTCLSFNSTGFTGTVAGTGTITVSANAVYGSGTTFTNTGNWTFNATSGTQQITGNGTTLSFTIIKSGAGGTLQLQDNLTMDSTRSFTLSSGTLDLNSHTLSAGLFASSSSNVRSVDFGTGNITLTGNAASIYNTSIGTNLTFTGTPVVNCTYAGSTGTRTITSATNAGAFTSFPTFNISAGSDIVLLSNTGSTGCLSLNFTGFTGTCSSLPRSIVNNLTLVSGMTLTNTGTIAFVGTSGTQQVTTAGKTLDCQINFTGVGGTVAFQDALTQGSTRAFTITNGTIQLKNGVTSTVGAFATSSTNQKFLQSTLAGSQATLSQASGTVNVSNLVIQDINATGGAVWFAPISQLNVDVSNNDGWDFFVQLGQYMYTRRKNKRLLIS
jgi:hypothetical protein